MNRPLLGRIFPFLLAFYAVSLAAFFAWAFVGFTNTGLIASFRWEYALKRAFVLFMRYLIPIHAAAVAVAASTAGTSEARATGGQPQPFNRIVSSTLVAFLVLTAGYTALFEGVAPGAQRRLSDMENRSTIARMYRAQAVADIAAKDYRAALDAMNRVLAIDPGDKQLASRVLEIEQLAAHQAAPAPAPAPAVIEPGESAQALFEKAQAAFDRQDWFTAHYYAQAASSLDPRRIDATRLAALSWDRLSGLSESATDEATKALYQQKKEAFTLLESGNAVGAYYRFTNLAARYPKDKDIATNLAEAQRQVLTTSFFVDDARKAEGLPGTQSILFLQGDAETREAVFIGKMVELPGGETYFYDIEAVRYAPGGSVVWHLTAPYGRREGSAVLMRSIDRRDAAVQFLPLYTQGTRPATDRNLLTLGPTTEEMRALSVGGDTLGAMSIAQLWRLRADLASFGVPRAQLNTELAMKLVMPFAFLILSLLAMALGWAFRARTAERLPVSGVILLPLAPIVLALLSMLYLYAHRIIVGFSVLAMDFRGALITLGVVQLVLLAVALALVAGQTTR